MFILEVINIEKKKRIQTLVCEDEDELLQELSELQCSIYEDNFLVFEEGTHRPYKVEYTHHFSYKNKYDTIYRAYCKAKPTKFTPIT